MWRLRHRPIVSLGAAAMPALAGFVLLAARALEPAPLSEDLPATTAADPAPPVLQQRMICSLANDDAKRAYIDGADGGLTVVSDERSYWLFGDTLFIGESGKQIEQNSIAWSDKRDPGECPALTYYSRDGIGIPFLPKDGSLTSWPSGAWANSDGTIDFYTVYVYGSGPYAYWIGEVGLARLDPGTMQVNILARRLWTPDSGFRSQPTAAQPVEIGADGLLHVIVQSLDGEKMLARVAPGQLHIAAAYEYWDGASWSNDPLAAVPLWPIEQSIDGIDRLANFENSAHIAWNPYIGKYVAMTNTGHAAVGVRTASRLEGPWTDARAWLDCTSVAEEAVPVCYSPLQHPQFNMDGGRTMLVTFTRMASYDVVVYEVTLATPIREYRLRDGTIAYASAPPRDARDLGVAFYASDAPMAGLVPVYLWQRDDESLYALERPAEGFTSGAPAFYAAVEPVSADLQTTYQPVYSWHNGDTQVLSTLDSGLEEYGFSREGIAFYAP